MQKHLNRALLLFIIASSAVAASTGARGVLFGDAFLNGNNLETYAGVIPGDVIRTKQNVGATLQSRYSVALIAPDSVLRVENKSLALEFGTINLRTGRDVDGMTANVAMDPAGVAVIAVQARNFEVIPESADLAEFEVTRSNGLIAVKAGKNGIVISCGSNKLRLEEGHRVSTQDAPGCKFISQ